jgi:murein DD-endopeptidase MepM/ murein hydrolase activator NlpD
LIQSFPKRHFFAAAFISALLVFTLALSPSSNVNATRIPIELEFTTNDTEQDSYSKEAETFTDNAYIEVSTENAHRSDAEDLSDKWLTFTIKPGNTLSELFLKAGLNDRIMYEALKHKEHAKELSKIFPGEQIAFLLNEDNSFQKVKLIRNPIQSVIVSKDEHGNFSQEIINRTPDTHITYTEGKIDSSLFLAGQKAGLSEAQIMELANIFGWDIDFILDIREGDSFNLIYEELFIDGEKYKSGRILAANFINQGKTFSAVLYEHENGDSNYFTPEGESMRKAFIRTPVDFARISSHFNLKRKHPILHKIRAHKGTDYAATHGTPIKATGDGKIINARNKGGYGKTVIIQHGNKITTLYAHLSKYARGIQEGRRVKQGQVIGYIGSTGLASGPHLHYEFRVNGIHKNPLKVKLPHADPIPKEQLARFKLLTTKYLAQLNTFSESYQLASSQQ